MKFRNSLEGSGSFISWGLSDDCLSFRNLNCDYIESYQSPPCVMIGCLELRPRHWFDSLAPVGWRAELSFSECTRVMYEVSLFGWAALCTVFALIESGLTWHLLATPTGIKK